MTHINFRRILYLKKPSTLVGIISFVLAILFSTLTLSSTSHAATAWDNLVHPWNDPLQVCHTAGSDCADITATYASLMASKCSAAYSAFASAASNPNGHLVILEGTNSTSSMLPWYVRIGWYVGSGGSALTQFYSNGYPANYKIGVYATRFVDLYWDGTVNTCNDYGSGSYTLDISQSAAPYTNGVYLSTYPVTYPSGYVGDNIPDGTAIDHDGDDLSAAQELIQGTSDSLKDTDGDGIDDLKESQWYSDRNDVFCKSDMSACAYPSPTKKDLYVEIDWMNDGAAVYKPTTTQLDLVKSAFNGKGIDLHFDTGQYGGGEELIAGTDPLPYHATTGITDYYDYKNGGDGITAKFSSNRASIWRYMIYGYNYSEDSNSSGWSETMGDDIFISGGLIKDMITTVSNDRAIADTIVHEIGHSICLSDERVWSEQSSGCIYKGIDNDSGDNNVNSADSYYNLENYKSVMNYRYQLTNANNDLGVVDLSDGSHGSGDHDDWSAVLSGMVGFSGSHTVIAYGANTELAYYMTPDGGIILEESSKKDTTDQNNQEQNSPMSNENANSPTSNQLPLSEKKSTDMVSAKSEDSRPDWTPVLLAGGAVILVMIASTLIIRRRKTIK